MANGKVGRRGLYETHIKPQFEQIRKMLNEGASERQVAEALGVSYPSWSNYKRDHEELRALCNEPRTQLVGQLRSALVKRAMGFTYEEKKQYITEDENGNKKKHTEITTKYALPDVTALFGALKIYDQDKLEYDVQAQRIELQRQELELRKTLADNNNW